MGKAAGLALTLPDGTALFLKRSKDGDHPNEWCFPGGHLEDGETPEEAAYRETREETGWIPDEEVKPKKITTKKSNGATYTTFRHKLNNPFIPTLNDEHIGWAWAPVDDPPQPLHPDMNTVLSKMAADQQAMLATSPNAGAPLGTVKKKAVDELYVYDYEFEPYLHPRYPKGTPKAGSFMPRGEEDKDKIRAKVAAGEGPKGGPQSGKGEEGIEVGDLPEEEVKRKIIIDRTHQVRWMSIMSLDGATMYVDESLPTELEINGKALDPAEPLLRHELSEWKAMRQMAHEYEEEHGQEPGDEERKQIYLTAHTKVATPAEKAWMKENGYDWDAWEAWTKGVLAQLENRKVTNPPPDPDVKPLPHDPSQLEAAAGIGGDAGAPEQLVRVYLSGYGKPAAQLLLRGSVYQLEPTKALAELEPGLYRPEDMMRIAADSGFDAEWSENKHPRGGKGTEKGGQFVKKGEGGGGAEPGTAPGGEEGGEKDNTGEQADLVENLIREHLSGKTPTKKETPTKAEGQKEGSGSRPEVMLEQGWEQKAATPEQRKLISELPGRMQKAVDAIPAEHAALLQGVKMFATGTVSDAKGKGVQGMFWFHGQIAVAATVKTGATLTPLDNPEHVTTHEMGHALDQRLGISNGPLKQLMQQEVQALPRIVKENDGKFWIDAGPSEWFAELYGAAFSPNKEGSVFGMRFHGAERNFAKTLKAIRSMKVVQGPDGKPKAEFSLDAAPAMDELVHLTVAEDGSLRLAASATIAADEAVIAQARGVPIMPPLALDKASVRTYDADGRLHVAQSNISKADVNPYVGHEIPGWEQLGLDPNKVYKLLRHPEELAQAAPTFNNIPLLSTHVPVSADDHKPDLIIGATGSDASFEPPYLRNSLVIWAKEGIDAIESEIKKELSSAYRYTPDMTPGNYEGQAYDGVMRNICGNHVALVQEGRAGADVVVGDSGETVGKELVMTKEAVSRKAVVTRRAATAIGMLSYYLRPQLAQDAKPVTGGDLLPLFDGVTGKNWKEKRPGIVKGLAGMLKGKLAQDEGGHTPDDVAMRLIDMLDGGGKEDGLDESVSEAQHKAMGAAAGGESNLGIPKKVGEEFMEKDKGKTFDNDVMQQVCQYLDGKIAPEHLAELKSMLEGHIGADSSGEHGTSFEDPNKPIEHKKGGVVGHHTTNDKKAPVGDEPPPFKGMPKVGGKVTGDSAGDGDKKVSKQAMDEAIGAAVKIATDNTMKLQRDIREAERAVRPYIGDLAVSFDSAEAVYRHTLKALGVKGADEIHSSALKTVLEMLPTQASTKKAEPRVALDENSSSGFTKRNPEASRIRIL